MTKPSDIFITIPEAPFKSRHRDRLRGEAIYKIYPICALDDLIAVLRSKEEPEVVVRYLVDMNGYFWFAEEGHPSKLIPSHNQMVGNSSETPTCLTAGNLVFSDDYQSIIAIDHKSGNFKPSFNSLLWALVILAANEASFAKLGITLNMDLSVDELNTAGGLVKKHILTKADIIEWVHDTVEDEDLVYFAEQPTAIKTVYYATPARRFHFHASPTPLEYDADVEDDSDDDESPSPTQSIPVLR